MWVKRTSSGWDSRALGARTKHLVVSTLGVGSDYNEALMVEIATQGGGRFYHVQHANEISAYLTGELGEFSALGRARNADPPHPAAKAPW